MKISVIGSGYVGLVTGTCFAEFGNHVICVDIDTKKVENLMNGIIPIYEPGLKELILKNSENGTLIFTSDIKHAVENTEIIFIAVGTPPGEDGSADLHHVLSVAKDIGSYINKYKIVVDKSTVPVGTGDEIRRVIRNELNRRNAYFDFDIVSNPEFLKEGTGIYDFINPDRVVIGSNSERAKEKIRRLYLKIVNPDKMIFTTIRSAEMIKYAANSMLATRISFINDISNLCEIVGADIEEVKRGVGSDKRIGQAFLNPGIGYGGSCFHKDVEALIKTAKANKYDMTVLKSVEELNSKQKTIIIKKIRKYFSDLNEDINGMNFAIWGLAFKPDTDDMREAPSIMIINELINLGAKVLCYDPQAMKEAYKIFGDKVTYGVDKYTVLEGADALLILTEWRDFREADLNIIEKSLKRRVIFDGRNVFDANIMTDKSFDYISMGRNCIYNSSAEISETAVSGE